MKHIKLFAILIATIATIFSCQKTEELAIDIAGQTLTANAPGSGNDQAPETKVSFTEDGITQGQINLAWQVGDVITLYDKSNDRVGNWKVESVASDGKANFTKVDGDALADGVNYTAVYPASTTETLEDWNDEKLYANGLIDRDKWQYQSGNDDMSHLDDKLRMKSQPFNSTQTINFTHQASIITVIFNSPTAVTSACFVDNSEQPMDSKKFHVISFNGTSSGDYKAHFMISPNPSTSRRIELEMSRKIIGKKNITTAFEAGKHYTWDLIPKLYLADISADDVPEGDTWTIEDADATADNKDKFAGVIAALETIEATRTINLVFPNLTTLPEAALNKCKPNAKWTLSAPNVTTVGREIFSSTENITTIDLPKATTIDQELCNAESLVALTIAKEERVISTHFQIFLGMPTENVDLITHESNASGMRFKLSNRTIVGPFKSVNGVILKGFPDDAVLVMERSVKTGRVNNTSSIAIPEEGLSIDNNNKSVLESLSFYVGYDKGGTSSAPTYKKFTDVTWSFTGEGSELSYFTSTTNTNGHIKLTLSKSLPTTKTTVEVTAKAPNKESMSFKIYLQASTK